MTLFRAADQAAEHLRQIHFILTKDGQARCKAADDLAAGMNAEAAQDMKDVAVLRRIRKTLRKERHIRCAGELIEKLDDMIKRKST